MLNVLYYEDKQELVSCFSMLKLNSAQLQLATKQAKSKSFVSEHKELMAWAKKNMPPDMLFEKQEDAIESLFEAASFLFVMASYLNHKLEKIIVGNSPKKKQSHVKLVKS